MSRDLTAERLRAVLAYNPETGLFTRRISIAKFRAGEVAGTQEVRDGRVYLRIGVDGVRHYAHRLAWLYSTGAWPVAEVDHIDGNGLNNRIANLRDVSRAVNGQNMRQPHKDSRTGVLGVTWVEAKGRWRASITHNGRPKFLGYFDTAEAAQVKYLETKRRLHEGCTL